MCFFSHFFFIVSFFLFHFFHISFFETKRHKYTFFFFFFYWWDIWSYTVLPKPSDWIIKHKLIHSCLKMAENWDIDKHTKILFFSNLSPIKPIDLPSTRELNFLKDRHPWTDATLPRVPCWLFLWCWTFDCFFFAASFRCRLQCGGCRGKMQMCRLVGLRFFPANEVVFYPPPPKPSGGVSYFWPLQQCFVSPAAVTTFGKSR